MASKRVHSGWAVSFRTWPADIARRSLSEDAPAACMNARPRFSASASDRGLVAPTMLPLSMMAPANRPLEMGEIIWTLTDRDPADWPAIVTHWDHLQMLRYSSAREAK